LGGAVLNVAVEIDGKKPVSCCSRFIREPVVKLSVVILDKQGHTLDEKVADAFRIGETVTCRDHQEFCGLAPTTPCGLLRAVLVVLGVVDAQVGTAPMHDLTESGTLSHRLLRQFGGGLEVACMSALPAGSGMGGSSILAACILKSVSELIGVPSSNEALVYQVSQVEQLLTTGGGWQDQVGGIYGGFKIGRSSRGLPLRVEVQELSVPAAYLQALESRMLVVYSGQQRLAKNTLIKALRKYSVGSHSMVASESLFETVPSLVTGAEKGAGVLQSVREGAADASVDTIAAFVSNMAAVLNR
jgi:fucokinase